MGGVWVGQIPTEDLPGLEDPAVLESRGLERVTFTPYEK